MTAMRQFLCKRTRLGHDLKSVEVFAENEDIELGLAAELARLDGLEIEVFVGTDLVDVVGSHKSFFEDESAAAMTPSPSTPPTNREAAQTGSERSHP